MPFAKTAGLVFKLHVADLARRSDPADDIRRGILRKSDAVSRRNANAVRRDRIADLSVAAAAVVERQRNFEPVTRRDETRRIRHRDQFRRNLQLRRRRACGTPVVRKRRHAHFADEFRQIETDARLAVRDRNLRLPHRKRLETPRRNGAYARKHLRTESAAGFDSVCLQCLPSQDRQDAVVDIVKRMPGLAGRREKSDRIRRFLARQKVDALVHERHHRLRRAGGGDPDRNRRAFLADINLAIQPDRNLVFDRSYRDRRLSVRTHRKTLGVRVDTLNHAQIHVEVRRVRRFQGAHDDLRSRIRKRNHLRIAAGIAHHRQ